MIFHHTMSVTYNLAFFQAQTIPEMLVNACRLAMWRCAPGGRPGEQPSWESATSIMFVSAQTILKSTVSGMFLSNPHFRGYSASYSRSA